MAKKIGLHIYSFQLWNSGGSLELHKVQNGKSFLEIAEEYAQANKSMFTNDKNSETVFTFDCAALEEIRAENGKGEFDLLVGRVKTGEYGIESELFDVSDGSLITRKESQADVLPFGFCIAVAKGEIQKGIIILQSLGNFSMKTVFEKKLQECMDYFKIDYHVVWGQILPKAYLDRFFQRGRLEKVRLIRYEIPEDISERYGINYGVKQTREERIIYRPVGFLERWRREFQEWRSGQRSCTKIVELEDYEYDDMKLEFTLGRTEKTISLANTKGLQVNEDVTDLVDVKGGIPVFDSLQEVLKETAREYIIGMGLLTQ